MEENQRLLFIPDQKHPKVMEIFKVYADPISDILGDSTLTLKGYEIMMQDLDMEIPFSSDIWNIFKKNERTLTIYAKRHLEILEHHGEAAQVFLKNNQYKKYINGLRKKKIGMVHDGSILDSHERAFWYRQNIFKEIIEENILKKHQTSKNDYSYTTVDDVLRFFSGDRESKSISGKDLYSKFLNENGVFDFDLSYNSIGKYLNGMARFFKKTRVHFNGERRNIYSIVN